MEIAESMKVLLKDVTLAEKKHIDPIFQFILWPFTRLPTVEECRKKDKQYGERTFSKILLNEALMTSTKRFCNCEGRWEKVQEIKFPSPTTQT